MRVINPRSQTLAAGNDPAGKRQFLGDVDWDQSWKRLGDAHVRYEAPLDLQDGEARVWRRQPDVGTERDL